MSSQQRVIHEKLVRDRIPEIITTAGQTPVVRTLSPDTVQRCWPSCARSWKSSASARRSQSWPIWLR